MDRGVLIICIALAATPVAITLTTLIIAGLLPLGVHSIFDAVPNWITAIAAIGTVYIANEALKSWRSSLQSEWDREAKNNVAGDLLDINQNLLSTYANIATQIDSLISEAKILGKPLNNLSIDTSEMESLQELRNINLMNKLLFSSASKDLIEKTQELQKNCNTYASHLKDSINQFENIIWEALSEKEKDESIERLLKTASCSRDYLNKASENLKSIRSYSPIK